MALINKIRERSGLAVAIIAVGLILFLLGSDLLGPNSIILGKGRNNVGKINGRNISLEEYRTEVEKLSEAYQMQTGQKPSEEVMIGIRERAWNEMIFRYAYTEEFQKLGLEVTEDEKWDMIQGDNIHPIIQQAFANPQTGAFDKKQVIGFIQKLDDQSQEAQIAWDNIVKTIVPDRLRTKYANLIAKSIYVTSEEAKGEYMAQNTKADVKYLFVPFQSIPDSTIKVTDSQLQTYLDKHKNRFEAKESRTIEFVFFPLNASAEDSIYVQDELQKAKADLLSEKSDTLTVKEYSESKELPRYVKVNELPSSLKDSVSGFQSGSVFGPFSESGIYSLYKISDIKKTEVTRASHILFSTQGKSDAEKAEIKNKAEEVLSDIKKGASFEEMAKMHGSDGTAASGGDLGSFSRGSMVKAFEDAVFAAQVGLLPMLVETDFGYHIVKVTEPKSNVDTYLLTTIQKTMLPGEETIDKVFKKADFFAASSKAGKTFEENIKKEKFEKQTVTLLPDDVYVDGITGARSVVRWAFMDNTGVEDVSGAEEVEKGYIVARLMKKVNEGDVSIESFRDILTAEVRKEIKKEKILKKLGTPSGSFDVVSKNYGSDAMTGESQNLTLAADAITGIGFEPEAVGKIFALKQDQKTKPFGGENGILMFELLKKTPPTEIADYSAYKTQLTRKQEQLLGSFIDEAIKKNANIKDKRYRFW